VSDSDKIPKPPPPDDYSKTTPNIPISREDRESSSSDWEKTNYNYPAQPPSSDDWGNTVANARPFDSDAEDFNKTFLPGAKKPPVPDWGMTQANVKLPSDDFGAKQEENFGGAQQKEESNYGATTPYFRLPETERAKYQNVPPTPAQEAEKQKEEAKQKGGIPAWVWVSGGLLAMFLFAVFVLLVVYIFFLKTTGFEATVKGAPPGSSVLVDGVFWGVTSDDGSIKLPSLRAGETKKIEVVHPSYTCQPDKITGQDGVKPEPIIARCSQVAVKAGEDCANIKIGEEDKAERCAGQALDQLSNPPSPEELTKALNIFIINFASGKFDIPPVRLAFLQKAATYIQKLPPSVVIEVGGHTDNSGNDSANQTLSDNRAKSVRDALVKFGVNPAMLTEKGYGASKPKASNDTDNGKFQNRRIEYSVVKK